jgi:Cys-tRNA(Pro)/Cys-tRNA(Cys) deacylase
VHDLREALARDGIRAEIVDLGTPMPTAADAAAQLGVPLARIFKSLVLETSEGEIVIAVLAGDQRLDMTATAAVFGATRVRFATADKVHASTGYPAGGTPPLGYPTALRSVVDEAVWDHQHVYCGGGRAEWLLKIEPGELVRATGRATAWLARPSPDAAPRATQEESCKQR